MHSYLYFSQKECATKSLLSSQLILVLKMPRNTVHPVNFSWLKCRVWCLKTDAPVRLHQTYVRGFTSVYFQAIVSSQCTTLALLPWISCTPTQRILVNMFAGQPIKWEKTSHELSFSARVCSKKPYLSCLLFLSVRFKACDV